MQTNRLGCLTSTGIVAALIAALAIVGLVIASGGLMFSPGNLNNIHGVLLGGVTSHAEIAGNCKSCHVAPWEKETMSDRCLVCHSNVNADMKDVLTPHGRMYAIDPQAQCRDCHPEHRGVNAMLTEIEDWRYPHELSGFSLAAHQFKAPEDPFKCADCHGSDVTTFDQAICISCHEQRDLAFIDAHKISYGENCTDCHDGVDRLGKDFTHANFAFQLTGKHTDIACENCHVNEHNLTEMAATAQDCTSCHIKDDPHQGALGPACAKCHTADGWKPAHFDHNLSVFKLTDAHTLVACEKCHTDKIFKGTPQDCFSCHKQIDPHTGALGQDCASCHTPTTWQDITFDHSKSAFPLLGKHTTVQCNACHKDKIFVDTPQDCYSCHALKDAHNGQLGTDCARCHNPSDWKDVHFDHNNARFKLTGNHLNVACSACHVNGVYRGTPMNCYACHASKDNHNGQLGTACENCHNPSGWQNVTFDHNTTAFKLTGSHSNVQCNACHANGMYKGTPTDCYSCHAAQDHHNGQFGTACGSCHRPTSWQDVIFDHGKTAFPLTGKHVNVQCQACHKNGVFKGTPTDCYSCHAAKDNHNGQFGTNCGSCHNPSGWQNVTFDHNKSAFPLTGKHVNVQCSACHKNGVFKGTPTDCYSCHAAKDNHNGQFGTSCGSCHNPSGWQNVTFDHNKSAFPLTGQHVNVQCSACHKNGVYKGTPTDCYSCHAAKDNHNGQFGTSCGSCHNPSGWQNVTFDHNNTAFPLIGHHTNLSCSKCHSNGVYVGTPTQCIACHQDQHNGANGTDCSICHTPIDWGKIIKP